MLLLNILKTFKRFKNILLRVNSTLTRELHAYLKELWVRKIFFFKDCIKKLRHYIADYHKRRAKALKYFKSTSIDHLPLSRNTSCIPQTKRIK